MRREIAGSVMSRRSFDDEHRPEEIISVYTRADALADGTLIDLTAEDLMELVEGAGFTVPVAMTAAAFDQYVALTAAAEAAGCDVKGRLWDVLTMLRLKIKCAHSRGDRLLFDFMCVVEHPRPRRCTLKAVIGPDDDGQPCLTVMLPGED